MLNYCFVKTSIVYFYRRIFVTHKNTIFDIMTKMTIVVILLWTLTFILEVIFGCGSHLDANWGSSAAQHLYCSKIGYTSELGLGGSDLALDVILLVFPMPKVNDDGARSSQKHCILLRRLADLEPSHEQRKKNRGNGYFPAWSLVSALLKRKRLLMQEDTDL